MSTSYARMHPNDVISLIVILASVYISDILMGLIIFIWLHLLLHSFKLGPNLFYTSKEQFYVVNPAHFSVYYPSSSLPPYPGKLLLLLPHPLILEARPQSLRLKLRPLSQHRWSLAPSPLIYPSTISLLFQG